MKPTKLPALILAVALQVLPITRVFVAVTPVASPSYAIISTWIAGAVALLGSYHAVSGASSILISPTSATVGAPYSGVVQYSGSHATSARSWELRNNWNGAQSGCNTVYEIAPGLWLTNAPTYLVRVGGTPTTTGTFNFTMRIWSSTGCSGGDSDTRSASITITGGSATAPSITTQPVGQTVTAGGNASFTVIASGTAPLNYQWRLNGGNLSGATGSTLNLTGVTTNQAGSYTVVVNNSAGSVTSSPAILIVNPAPIPPTITAQPVGRTVTAGANVLFSVTASGTAPLGYQWRLNGGNLSGATGSSLNLTGVTTNQAGSYTVVVNNSAGSITSSPAILIVNPAPVAPTINSQPIGQTVTAGANVSFSVAATGTAPLGYQWRLNGGNLSGATGSTLNLANVTTNQAGTYTVVVNNSVGSVTSSPALLIVSVTPVNNAPAIAAITDQIIYVNTSTGPISFNVSDIETPAADLTLSAISSNPSLIPAANVVFGGSGNNRTVTLTPVANLTGTATITVTVSDGSATASTSFQLVVQIVPPPPPPPPSNLNIIATNGVGTISPNLNVQALVQGKTYTVTAVPGQDQVFAGWTGSTNSSSPALKFVMSSNLSFVANFIPSPYIPAAGNYNGLFYENDEVRQESAGFFSLAVTAKGAYSGKLQAVGSSYKLSGALDLQRRATNVIVRKHTNNLTVELRVGADEEAGKLFGEVSDGNWASPLLGDRAVFNAKTNPAPFATNYTLAIPSDTSTPSGIGYGTAQARTSGSVSFAGTLADGTKISQSATLSPAGYWPLYVSLYSRRGILLGWARFTNQPTGDLDGTLAWIKPFNPKAKYYAAGFTNECETTGSTYTVPKEPAAVLNMTHAMVSFIGGNLASDITNSVVIKPNSVVSTLNDDDDSKDISLKFSTSKGTYTGTVKDPATRKSFNFQGAVLQKRNVGLGFLLVTNQSSKVAIETQTNWPSFGDHDNDDDD